ncbi:hypothetical protein YC2023_060318 [Brassica napus]
MKDIPKFSDNVNVGIPNNEGETIGSPTSQSPGLSSFSINLSSDDGGSNSSQRPIGSKKAKLKRKLDEVIHESLYDLNKQESYRKGKSNNNLLLHQIFMDNFLAILETQDQVYLIININIWILYV